MPTQAITYFAACPPELDADFAPAAYVGGLGNMRAIRFRDDGQTVAGQSLLVEIADAHTEAEIEAAGDRAELFIVSSDRDGRRPEEELTPNFRSRFTAYCTTHGLTPPPFVDQRQTRAEFLERVNQWQRAEKRVGTSVGRLRANV